jgi:hypothetical protein
MQIAAQPLEKREWAFQKAEQAMREAAVAHGLSTGLTGSWINLQMQAVRQMVKDIDLGGRPQGGHA